MRVIYLKLVNVAGLIVGSGRNELEISFENSKNKIISIQGPNGIGKTVLLSSLSPFAHVTSLDERSSLPYIIPKKNGYKEIHYKNEDDQYVIKHYYKATKDGHTVKSYFNMNGEELNENGNVTSFLSLVELHFSLTPEMMRLIRLGSNVDSFINLTPARRKEYIGKLIEEIDLYLKIHKKINEDLRVVKVLLSSNNTNLNNCHISDIVVEEDRASKLHREIKKKEKERDDIINKIGKIQSLMANNDIDELRRKQQEAESSLIEFDRTENEVKTMRLENVSVDTLIKKRTKYADNKIDVQSKINSYRISIDSALKNIENLELSIKKVTSNNDIKSLINIIETLRESVSNTSNIVKKFIPLGATSDNVYDMLSKLSSFNQISRMIYSFGNKPVDIYLKLKRSNKSVDKFLKDQAKRVSSNINENDLKMLMDQVFKDDDVITPNCDVQYAECPYYRLSELITTFKEKLDEETYDTETLRYIQIISNNVDNILNEIDVIRRMRIPDKLMDDFKEKSILDRMANKLPFFNLSDLEEYLSILKEYEIYQDNLSRLKQHEHQLSIYKKSGVDTHMNEINRIKESISFYKNNISVLQSEITSIDKDIVSIDQEIGIVTKYINDKKYRSIIESTLKSTNKILGPLEEASREKTELEFSLREITNLINISREEHRKLEAKINEYKRLIEEGKKLSVKLKDLDMILKAASTKKGIPVFYINQYLGRIRDLSNNLLKLIYDDSLRLSRFNVTEDTFEIPYIKNGYKVLDVKYASQSELPLITMALSFALSNRASGNYNIILLDEIDAGLDEDNRSAFLKMLYMQMSALKSEQVFLISHNLSQMVNIPMDCIRLADTNIVRSKLQNVIYE